MKKGRKPLNEQVKIQKKLEQLWKGNFLNLSLLEELQLLNVNFPTTKQIFTKDFVMHFKKQKNYRQVKIVSSNLLIDCRTIKIKELQNEKINEISQQIDQNLQQPIQLSNIQNNPEQRLTQNNNQSPLTENNIELIEQPSIIEILPEQKCTQNENILKPSQIKTQSNNQSIIELKPIVKYIQQDLIPDENEYISNSNLQSLQSKTQQTNNQQKQDQIPQFLVFQPNSTDSFSLSFSQELSESFVQKLMDESFFEDNQLKLSESLFGNIPKIQKDPNINLYDQTFDMLKVKINQINQYQFDQLLRAYNHNFQHLQKIILNDINQIKLLISKYQNKKPRII